MKKWLVILLATAALAIAEPLWTILTEKTLFGISYEYAGLSDIKVYTNGVFHRKFAASENIYLGDSTNGVMILGLVFTNGLAAGNQSFTLTAITADGVESDPSNALPLQFRPRKPDFLKRYK